MKYIKIMLLMKREFSEYYEIKHYNPQPAVQIAVKKYSVQYQKVVVD